VFRPGISQFACEMCGNSDVLLLRHPDFLTPNECRLIRQGMDRGAVEAAEVLEGGARQDSCVRNASLVEPQGPFIHLVETRLEACRRLIGTSLQLALGEREGPGFVRYPDGGYFRTHRDHGRDPAWPGAERRAVSMVIFLNSSDRVRDGDFDGGVLRLFQPDGDVEVVPEAGLLVAFPSDVPHEVTEVIGGTRDSIVDWFYFGSAEESSRATPIPREIGIRR